MNDSDRESDHTPPIKINPQIGNDARVAAFEAVDLIRKRKIQNRWSSLLTDSDLISALPESIRLTNGTNYQPEIISTVKPVSLPLKGGGEIRLSRGLIEHESSKLKLGLNTLVIWITTTNAKGEPIEIPNLELPRDQADYEGLVQNNEEYVINDFLPPQNYRTLPVDSNEGHAKFASGIKEANRFLALFKATDIDSERLGKPSNIQKAIIQKLTSTPLKK